VSAAAAELTPAQREKERSIALGLIIDSFLLTSFFIAALASGSFTLLAECIRAVPMNLLEAGSLMALRRIHRQRLAHLEFGAGKLEQLINVTIGCGMLAGAAWIIAGGIAILSGDQHLATPIGLAMAAAINSVNLLLNLVVWDAVRRAAALESSMIMAGQLASRSAKLMSSVVVQCTMTVAAVSMDPLIAAWADVGGSIFVAGVIVWTAVGLLRSGVPDLMDLRAGAAADRTISAVLERGAADLARVDRVRSRRSGSTVFVEATMAFPGALTVGEVDGRIARLQADLAAAVPGAELAVVLAEDGPVR